MRARPWRYHPAAQTELDDAVDRYEEEREGIGDAFLDAVETLLEKKRAVRTPGTPSPGVADENVRRLLLTPRFPYALVLLIDERVVLATAHLARRPNYWRRRLKAERGSATRERSARRGRGSAGSAARERASLPARARCATCLRSSSLRRASRRHRRARPARPRSSARSPRSSPIGRGAHSSPSRSSCGGGR